MKDTTSRIGFSSSWLFVVHFRVGCSGQLSFRAATLVLYTSHAGPSSWGRHFCYRCQPNFSLMCNTSTESRFPLLFALSFVLDWQQTSSKLFQGSISDIRTPCCTYEDRSDWPSLQCMVKVFRHVGSHVSTDQLQSCYGCTSLGYSWLPFVLVLSCSSNANATVEQALALPSTNKWRSIALVSVPGVAKLLGIGTSCNWFAHLFQSLVRATDTSEFQPFPSSLA